MTVPATLVIIHHESIGSVVCFVYVIQASFILLNIINCQLTHPLSFLQLLFGNRQFLKCIIKLTLQYICSI